MLDCTPKFSYTQYMLTLSDASYDTKEIMKWGGLIIAGLVVLIVIIRMLLIAKEAIFPTPPPKPTVLFGKLESQVFPQNVTDQTLTYSVNTLSGYLPALVGQAKVFTIQTFTPDLLSLSRAKQAAAGASYTSEPSKISDTLFEWTSSNTTDVTTKLTMDIVNDNFNITSNYLSNTTYISALQGFSDQNNAINDAVKLLTSLNSLPSDIDQTKTQASLFSLKNGSLTSVTNVSDAQAIRVVFHQQDTDTLPIYYENPNSSNINVLVDANNKILEADYIHQIPVADNFSTYPLKTTEQAFAELQQGKAYIAFDDSATKDIAINNVFLAYYIGSQPQKYLMPIIVFAKDSDFFAYVPAVTDEWIGK
jgi:hypothetical protein